MSSPVTSLIGSTLYPISESGGYYLKTPIFILSVFVSILKQFFSTSPRMSLETSQYLWTPDPAESQVWISEEFSADRKIVGKRPSILVIFGDQQYPTVTLGDLSSFNSETSTSHTFNLVNGQVSFRCISENMLSSLELATEVRYFLSSFRQSIQDTFCLDRVRPISTSKAQKIEEYKEYWATDVNCEIIYQESFGTTQEALRIRSVLTGFKISESAKKILPQHRIS